MQQNAEVGLFAKPSTPKTKFMQTLEGMKRRIESTEELHSVVKTMKSLAAVNIRQYERAVTSLKDYRRTVEMGLQIVLRGEFNRRPAPKRATSLPAGLVVFGTDQGMCGSLNEQVAGHVEDSINGFISRGDENRIVAVGERVAGLLEDGGRPVETVFPVPSSVSAITATVQRLLVRIERWTVGKRVSEAFLFYSEQLSGAAYHPRAARLLPLDEQWLSSLRKKKWSSRSLPMFTMGPDALLSALIREYLFVILFQSMAKSLASENAARLASMQGAGKNIEERLGELYGAFHQRRQMTITEELLDIVAGFEALRA
jgi:F-type H+-transporting ATPase subunit gamma